MVILFANIKKRLPKLELLDSLFLYVEALPEPPRAYVFPEPARFLFVSQ